ncbi:MAG: tripartite tricarboxylate transporter substrate binding protein, partial [Hyphomicrobium sp.]
QSGLDPATNFATVSFLASNPLALVGKKGFAASTLPELTAWMKGNRAKVAHPGVGTTGHLTSVVMARRLGVEIDLVPYRGAAPAMQDVVAGHVDLFIGTPLSVADLVKSGAIKGFGVTSKAPVPQMPTVASLTTISPDLEVQFWTGMFATAGTPKAVIEKLNVAIDQIIASEAVAKVWKATDQQAYSKADRSPARGDEILRAEVKRWSGLVRENNIKAD